MTPENLQTDDALRPVDSALADFLGRQFPDATAAQCQLAALVSRQLGDGHLCLPIKLLDKHATRHGLLRADRTELLENNPLLAADGSRPLVMDRDSVYLHRYWQLETDIAASIRQRCAREVLSGPDLAQPLSRLFPKKEEHALHGATNWQKLACALAGRSRFGIITGGPGTGKTTTVVKLLALHQMLAQKEGRRLTIRLAAPTGKAAARLSESISGAFDRLRLAGLDDALIGAIPHEAITLHRLLGSQRDSRHFRHNARQPLMADLVVVDEASMIDIDMMAALLDALPDDCTLVLVGDKDQLESVEAGAIMGDLCRDADEVAYSADTLAFLEQAGCEIREKPSVHSAPLLSQHTVKLRKSWRAADAEHILELATAVNNQRVDKANALFDGQGLKRRGMAGSDRVAAELFDGPSGLAALLKLIDQNRPAEQADSADIDRWAQLALNHLKHQQLLSPLRSGPAGVEALNARIRRQVISRGLATERPDHPFFEGEPLLVTKNLYEPGVMNGDMGLVLDHPVHGLRVAFDDGLNGVRWILPELLEAFVQGGYAITVHQSQGSEYRRVILLLPDRFSPVLSKELVYTAITRASRQFVLLEMNPDVFSAAVKHRSPRYSNLASRLHDDWSE